MMWCLTSRESLEVLLPTVSAGNPAAKRQLPFGSLFRHFISFIILRHVQERGENVQQSKNIDYAKQHHTPHCWLSAKVMYLANSAKSFSWLTRSTSILLMKNVQMYVQCVQLAFLVLLNLHTVFVCEMLCSL